MRCDTGSDRTGYYWTLPRQRYRYRRPCGVCGGEADRVCDGVALRMPYRLCRTPLCAEHAYSLGAADYCPTHDPRARRVGKSGGVDGGHWCCGERFDTGAAFAVHRHAIRIHTDV